MSEAPGTGGLSAAGPAGRWGRAGGAPVVPGLAEAQRSFASVLARAHARGDDGSVGREARAREAAESLVAVALVQPMLERLRASDRTAAPFAPGPAERQFRALMDADLAQRLVRAARFPLVERLARDLLSRGVGAEGEAIGEGAEGRGGKEALEGRAMTGRGLEGGATEGRAADAR